MAFYSGQVGSMTINGSTFPVTGWTFDSACSFDDTTNTESGGFYEDIPCIKSGAGSCAAVFQSSNIYGGLVAGAQAALTLKCGNSGKSISIPTAQIDVCSASLDAKLAVRVAIAFHTTGTFTMVS